MQVQHRRGMGGFERERQAAECRKTDRDGQAAEALHRCHIDRRQTGGGIQTKPHGAAGKGRKSQIVSKGVCNERRHERARIGHRLADITQGKEVVEAEQPIACGRKAQGNEHMHARGCAQLLEYLARMQVRKLPMQDKRDDCKYEERGERSDPAQVRTVGLFGIHYPLLARQRPVSDTMRVRRFLALSALEVLDVFLIVAFEPDDL